MEQAYCIAAGGPGPRTGRWGRMCRRLAVVACALAQPVLAAEPTATTVEPALSMLQKLQTAARKLDSSGVFTYLQRPVMPSPRIGQVVDGRGERTRLEIPTGPPVAFGRAKDAA